VAFTIDTEGGDQHQVVADIQPVNLDDQEVQLGQVRGCGAALSTKPVPPRASSREASRKASRPFQTDHVVLVPGRLEEVDTVRWMYRSFVDGTIEREIANTLNERGLRRSHMVCFA
jgi:hypothetical protein